MKFFSIFTFVLLVIFEVNALTITCSSLKGSRLFTDVNDVEVWDDAYSNQSIIISINTENNEASVEWVGSNNFKAPLVPLYFSKDEGWIIFAQVHPEVFRTYQYHFLTQNLALTESQSRLIVGGPDIKSYIGKCQEQ